MSALELTYLATFYEFIATEKTEDVEGEHYLCGLASKTEIDIWEMSWPA